MIGVGAIVFDADDNLLLIQRATEPAKGRWSIPGGLVELGETLTDAVRRETREETGLEIEPLRIVEVVERIHRDPSPGNRVRYHYVLVDYLCRITGDSVNSGLLQAASDAAQARWICPDQWQQSNPLDMERFTLDVIEKAWRMHRRG
uniref:NUDIX hydrolase n=1 Tax=mine drainage metagenome TaxID=410659 RepID=E6PZY7_9ZZZZ